MKNDYDTGHKEIILASSCFHNEIKKLSGYQ